jgi:peptidoglycan/LPS O-acetylase OafA/YrhL
MPITNALASVDSFFFMSGLLVTYTMLKQLDRHGFTWDFIPKAYLHRYLRLVNGFSKNRLRRTGRYCHECVINI